MLIFLFTSGIIASSYLVYACLFHMLLNCLVYVWISCLLLFSIHTLLNPFPISCFPPFLLDYGFDFGLFYFLMLS